MSALSPRARIEVLVEQAVLRAQRLDLLYQRGVDLPLTCKGLYAVKRKPLDGIDPGVVKPDGISSRCRRASLPSADDLLMPVRLIDGRREVHAETGSLRLRGTPPLLEAALSVVEAVGIGSRTSHGLGAFELLE